MANYDAAADNDDECGLYDVAGAAYIRAQLCENDSQQLGNAIANIFFLFFKKSFFDIQESLVWMVVIESLLTEAPTQVPSQK